jgi:hypothetical protein
MTERAVTPRSAETEESVGLPQITLEDRLLVALSGRGQKSIGEMLDAVAATRYRSFSAAFHGMSDEQFVEALEGFAADQGLHRAERDERNGNDGPPSARGNVRQ